MNAIATNPVIAAPLLDPSQHRVDMEVPAGLTLLEIVGIALPHVPVEQHGRFRVTMVSDRGVLPVDQCHWHRVRPHPGVRIVIRLVPGQNVLKTILSVVIAVAATALGGFFAAPLAGALGISTGAAAGLITAGVSIIGNLLVNALIPPPSTKDTKRSNNYRIDGWQNDLRPDAFVPLALGKVRYAPPFGARSYTEIRNDIQYIRAIFTFGYGPVKITDLQIGDTDIDEYDDIQIEIREGYASDGPLTLYNNQVIEESVGAELARPKPRDDAGNIISGDSIEKPVVRTTARNVTHASVIISFPSGLVKLKSDGGKSSRTVDVKIEQRPVNTSNWQTVTTLSLSAKKVEGFFRQYKWKLPARGTYEIRCTRMTDEDTSTSVQSRSIWVVLQSFRPEYPLNFDQPLGLVAIRIKATYQLNGTLDAFNALVSRVCRDYDTASGAWITRETSNPASSMRYVLQSAANAKPTDNAGIDLDSLAEFHDFCRIKDLKYDRVVDTETRLRELLNELAGAGRGFPRHDGKQWGVVIDRPADLVIVDEFSDRNVADFEATRNYIDPPHAFRVTFSDATNDYKTAERIVRWPGYLGPITLTEQLELPGKTDPDEIYIESRRRMYEAIYRPDVYSCMQDTPIAVATRGSKVAASFKTLQSVSSSGRVVSVNGSVIELDEVIEQRSGQAYAIRFRLLDGDDTIGTGITRSIVTLSGASRLLLLSGAGPLPAVGSIILFGPVSAGISELIVTRVEAGDNMASIFKLADASPIIDQLTDAEVAPTWSGVVGSEVETDNSEPPVPLFSGITSGFADTGVNGRITVLIEAGVGPVESDSFEIYHRISGAFAVVAIDASAFEVNIDDYSTGDVVEIKARALSPTGLPGPFTDIVTIVVGMHDEAVPGGIDADTVSLEPLLGGVQIAFETSDSTSTSEVWIYRSDSTLFDPDSDPVGTASVVPSHPYIVTDGDATRKTLLTSGGMPSSAGWTLGAGWSIADGVATHSGGEAGDLSQTLSLTSGVAYRIGFDVTEIISGSIAVLLSGGSSVAGQDRSDVGRFADRITATGGDHGVSFSASSTFEGSIDNAVIYPETATCLAQGTHYYFLRQANDDGIAGPVVGPFAVNIV
ncbi:TipJ family phage tail tip protein [Rhizobium halophytocola]|uniref:Tip attachment protein J HDII-ins2 domain-containing protein n=1 Tax=Rhizobium halophytocola TaxID=735519 RepID=A0ABS4E408_9HYPH|nr:phage tail protein [Rhizobium halophytocola]MBP1852678.1 hypothetical protein [Rhizobium halophytocola]